LSVGKRYPARVPEAVIDIQGLTKTYRAGLRRTPVHAVRNLAIAYQEARTRLSTNLVYGVVYFFVGVLLFTRRDVRLG